MKRHGRTMGSWWALIAVLLAVIFWGGGANALVANPYYTNPVLDPALQPKFVNTVPNPLVPGFILTPDTTTYGPTIDYYTVSARQIVQQSGLVSETTGLPLSTTYWGYGDTRATATSGFHTFPGPTFEIRSNRESRVLWANELPNTQLVPIDTTISCGAADCPPVSIVTHVHGAHVQGDSDGGPLGWFTPNFAQVSPYWDPNTKYGLPGTYSYPNTQEAGTIWYHDHAQRFTHTNVYAGLAGFYLIRDANEDAMQLNGTLPAFPYEVPLVIQDRDFYPDGSLALPDQPIRDLLSLLCATDPVTLAVIPSTCPTVNDPLTGLPIPSMTPEFFGGIIQVNGIVWPKLDVEPRPYRIRLLNGSDSRTYILQFADSALNPLPNIRFYQIGTDQGFLNAPVMQTQVIIQPGERLDVLVDFTGVANGTQVILQNVGPEGPYMGLPVATVATPATTGQIMAFNVNLALGATPSGNATPSTSPALITSLRPTPIVALTPTAGIPTRKLFLQEVSDIYGRLTLTLNGVGMMNPVTEIPTLNTTEIWEFANNTPDTHPIHLHLVAFQVLDRTTFDTVGFVPPVGGAAPVWTLTGLPVAPPPQEAGWKDTIQMEPGTVTRVIAKFDIAGNYVYHCHILSHEENDMMRPFVVTTTPTSIAPLAASIAGPQVAGTALPVKFTAEATTSLQTLRSADAFEYRFLVQAPGGALTPVQPYSWFKTFTWTPPTVPGTYTIRAEARAYGSVAPFDVFATTTHVLNGRLTGFVSDPVTGLPVAGATITVTGGPTVTSNALGHYALDIAAGIYTLTFSKAGMGSFTSTVNATLAGVTTADGFLSSTAVGLLSTTVVDKANRPIAGVTVTAVPTVAGTSYSGVSTRVGFVAIAVPPGTYNLTTTMIGYAATTTAAPITVTGGQSITAANLALTPNVGGSISGVVTDAATALPVAGASVAVTPGGFKTSTNATGNYLIAVPAGTYSLTASAPGYANFGGVATVVSGGNLVSNVTLTAAANGTITGKVISNIRSLAVPGASVTAIPGDYAAATDMNGNFSIAAPPGTYYVTASKLSYANVTVAAPITVTSGLASATGPITLTVTAKGAVYGRVTISGAATGLVGAVVSLQPGGYNALTNATGNYSIKAPPGTYIATAVLAGYNQVSGSVTVPSASYGVCNLKAVSATNGSLSGIVTASATGLPVSNAIVLAMPGAIRAVTGVDGVYSLSLPPGAYTISSFSMGYRALANVGAVTITTGIAAPAVNFALVAAPAALVVGQVGGVITPVNGVGVGGVTVTAVPTVGVVAARTSAAAMGENPGTMGPVATDFTGMTDMMGNYAINVPPGTYMLQFSAPGYSDSSSMVVVGDADQQSADVELEMEAVTGESEVSVHNANTDEDLADATVTITPGDITGTTDETGDFIVNLDPGTYTVTVSKAGYTSYSGTTEVVAGEVMTVDATLAPRATSSNNNDKGFCFIDTLGTGASGFGGLGSLVGLGAMIAALAIKPLGGRKNAN